METFSLWILAAALSLIVIIAVLIYNNLIRKRNNADTAWSNIDVQLMRRYDLIPNLVLAVKSYAKHEKETFAKIAELRSSFNAAKSPEEIGNIDRQMNRALKHLFAVSENYPDLKASHNFMMLQEELAGSENRIAYSRNNYNMAVMNYNVGVETFPGILVAGPMGFRKKEFFQADSEEVRKAVKINL
jgi:LemA protein